MKLITVKTKKPEYPVSLDKVQDETVRLALVDLFDQIPDKNEFEVSDIELRKKVKQEIVSSVSVGGTTSNFETTDDTIQTIDNMIAYCNIPAGYDAKIEFTCSATFALVGTKIITVGVEIDSVVDTDSYRQMTVSQAAFPVNMSMIYKKEILAPGNHKFVMKTTSDAVGNKTKFLLLERQMIVTPIRKGSL